MRSDDFASGELAERETYVAELEGRVVGWTSVGWRHGVWWMDDLWVLPAFMRRGIGSALFGHVATRGREKGASALELESDANATEFYERMGGRHVRDSEPTIWGPGLPIYAFELGE